MGKYTVGVVRDNREVSPSSSISWKSYPVLSSSACKNEWEFPHPARRVLEDGADEARRSSIELILDKDRVRDGMPFSGGGSISDGGEFGGAAEGLVIGELGTVYLHKLIVAARGLLRLSIRNPYMSDVPRVRGSGLIDAISNLGEPL